MHIAGPKLGGQAITITAESHDGMETGLAEMDVVATAFLLSMSQILHRIHIDDHTVLVLALDQDVFRTKYGLIKSLRPAPLPTT